VMLTKRESQIVQLLLAGWSNKEIAHELGIADNTLRQLFRLMYAKFQIAGNGHKRVRLAVQLAQPIPRAALLSEEGMPLRTPSLAVGDTRAYELPQGYAARGR
jgi:DNA-binding CsgD family transcriptional regulator